jgi:hypothetical protein
MMAVKLSGNELSTTVGKLVDIPVRFACVLYCAPPPRATGTCVCYDEGNPLANAVFYAQNPVKIKRMFARKFFKNFSASTIHNWG